VTPNQTRKKYWNEKLLDAQRKYGETNFIFMLDYDSGDYLQTHRHCPTYEIKTSEFLKR
jgi:hypothetical protein